MDRPAPKFRHANHLAQKSLACFNIRKSRLISRTLMNTAGLVMRKQDKPNENHNALTVTAPYGKLSNNLLR